MLTLTILATLLGPEITSAPYTPTDLTGDCSGLALASQGDLTFLAWPLVENGQPGIVAVQLDRNFHEVAGRRVFLQRPAAPVCPAAASDGSEVVIVWNVPGSTADAIESARFSSTLELREGPVTVNPSAPLGARPGIAWSNSFGGRFWIAAGQFHLEVPRSSLSQARSHSINPWKGTTPTWFDSVTSDDATSFALTARAFSPAVPGCNIGSDRCGPGIASYAVGASRPEWNGPHEISRGSTPIGTSTIACTGGDCLIAWFASGALFARWWTVETILPTIGTGQSLTSATDDKHFVLVWGSASGVMASVMTRTEPAQTFTVAGTTSSRRRPAILKLAPGRFLVGYEIVENGVTRLGGRVIEIDPPARRRIAR